MGGECLRAKKCDMSFKQRCEQLELPSETVPGCDTASQELAYIEGYLRGDRCGSWSTPLTADEILSLRGAAFEQLFHQPPVGPIPEYLLPYLSVHGCVAEYEEKIEELDRWKALELSRWLKERIGRNWCVAGKLYELRLNNEIAGSYEKFWFALIEDRPEGSVS